MNLYVRPNGTLQAIYDEAVDLQQIGGVNIKRASHVEPATDRPGQWTADLQPVGGPVLGPFATRREALDAEIAWLDAQLARGPVTIVEAAP
jgi:hypothetical protein